jgi:hypothetical protein
VLLKVFKAFCVMYVWAFLRHRERILENYF